MNKIVILCGPTGVGKSALAINIAKAFNTSIINGDAYQLYDNLNIGTAKPTASDMQQVTHELYSQIPSTKNYSVSDYQLLVRKAVDDKVSKCLLPLVVGGSGLYLESLYYSYDFSGAPRSTFDEHIYDNLSNEELHKLLKEKDLDASLKIHMNNRKRVLRALERLDEMRLPTKKEFVYEPLIIFLTMEREILYERINKRVDQMLEDGLLSEVEYLKTNHLFSQTSQKAIGYKELIDYLDGYCSFEDAVDKIKQASRNYAKRQITWFKNKPNVIMVDKTNLEDAELTKIVINKINEFIS